MSPVIRKKNRQFSWPARQILFVLTFLCILLMLITFGTDVFNRPVNALVGYVVVPLEKGVGELGSYLSHRSEELVQIRSLLEENERLKEQLAALTEENTILQQDKYELTKLRELVDLDEQYGEYHKTGARIIGKDTGNWYSNFVIDKGSADGLDIDMNVIAGGGLVGRITAVGPDWARVTAIISDNSNVSCMTIATKDNLIVSGDLSLMAEGVISYSQLLDGRGQVAVGDKVVTSNISDKYLPNILVGYIRTINIDNNNITKSGYLLPAVDFEHLSEVLVITDMKQAIEEVE